MKKFHNKYRIASARMQNWDYGRNAAYFITICTNNRGLFFGEIDNKKMRLNAIGKLAEYYWIEIPKHFPFIELGNFVVMPNHVHGILIIDKNDTIGVDMVDMVETRQCLVSTNANANENATTNEKTIGQKRFQNQGKNTVSSIVGSYKSVVTKNAKLTHVDFVWQSRFHDHIIRNDGEYQRISEYIINNPANWKIDKFHRKNV
jgi:REP element-mobilizing transposase RayT